MGIIARRVVTCALAFALTGCSAVFVNKPFRDAPPEADCTDTYVAPIADGLLTAALAAASISLLSHKDTCNPNDNNSDFCANLDPLAGAVLVIPTLVFASSALWGVHAVGRCRDLHARRGPPAPVGPQLSAPPAPPPPPESQ